MPSNPQVDDWFAAYNNPMKEVLLAVRGIILADPRMDECIKWQSPTFTYKGNLASFNPKSKQHASLMFHTGAHIPGDHPRLQGGGDTARYMAFATVAEVKKAAPEIKAVVAAWCAMKEQGNSSAGPARKKAVAKPVKQAAMKKAVGLAKKSAGGRTRA